MSVPTSSTDSNAPVGPWPHTEKDVSPHGLTQRRVQDAFDRSVALVMGVNAYQRGLPPLRTAVADAEAVGAVLAAEHGFIQVTLRDGEVTGDRLRRMLKDKLASELGRALGERDRLVLYFAGHGLSLPSEHGPEGHLLLADARPDESSTFLGMAELRALLGTLPCRHVLIVLDCCFAGTFRWAGQRVARDVGAPVYRETLDRFVNHRAWQVLVSASHDQTALDDISPRSSSLGSTTVGLLRAGRVETERQSPFAAAFLRGLHGAADYTKDGLIIAAELELFVRDAVEQATQVHQTPQLYKLDEHDRGEFVFQVPGSALRLEAAPSLLLTACLYQGLQPYAASERDRFFGRGRAVTALIDHVKAKRLTVVLGPSGVGKSSLLAAGLVPALRELPGWTLVETRPDARPDETLRDAIQLPSTTDVPPGRSLLEQITTWLSVHVSENLCLVIDQAEDLELLAVPEVRDRVLDSLAKSLDAHGGRLRVVLALRSELDPIFRASALGQWWNDAAFTVPALSHHELREIIERPARALELSFEPPSLVDTLIDEVLQAPAGLPLLSFALRELYVRCAARNTDRLLTQGDYERMGRLSGALSQRASALFQALVAQDPACAATARRVFLRMVVERDGEWSRRRAHRDEFVYADKVETARAAKILGTFRDARLVLFDKEAWEPANDWLARGWPMFSMWRTQFSTKALTLQAELANAAQRWFDRRRAGDLWSDDPRLADAVAALAISDSWLNAHERKFLAASLGRRRFRILAALGAVAIAMMAGLVVWDLYYRTHVAYFRDYNRRWGEPQGIDAMAADEIRARPASFKLVRKGHLGRVFHVELVRGDGTLAPARPGSVGFSPELELRQKPGGERTPCQWDFAFESDTQTVSTETARDRAGRVVYVLQYHGGPQERRKAQFLDENRDDARVSRGDAERVEFWRSPEGYDLEKHYTSKAGEAARNHEGISSEKLQYDEHGNMTSRQLFDETGSPTPDNTGVTAYRAAYDARGNQIAVTFLDAKERPTRAKDRNAGWRAEFDEHGNEIKRTFVDELNKPTRLNEGYTGYLSQFDAAGNVIRFEFFDEAGKRTRDRNGVAVTRSTFDASGNETGRMFFDDADHPLMLRDGYASYRATFDAEGNRTILAFFDAEGKPTTDRNGVTSSVSRFDPRGNEVERTYLGGDGKPTLNSEGLASYRADFDARGNEIERMYFDAAGKATRIKYGYAGHHSKFDPRDNEIERTYLDESKKPTRSKDQYAGYVAVFDSRGNQTDITYVDETKQRMRGKDNYASSHARFDARGNQIEITYLDENGKPIRATAGYAGLRTTFDERGHELEVVYLDEAGKPTRGKEDVAGYRSKRDTSRNETLIMFVDPAGNPTRVKDGFVGYRSTDDSRGYETERIYVDEMGKPTRVNGGYAGYRSTIDARGLETQRTYVDEAGNSTRTSAGYAGYRSTFDACANQLELGYLDEGKKPLRVGLVAGYRSKFDARGNELQRTWFDEAGKPVRGKEGYAGYRATVDGLGNVVDLVYLDEAGAPTRNNEGYAGQHSTFDAWGNETERRYLDEAGKAARSRAGYAGYRSTFDARGNRTETAFFKAGGVVTARWRSDDKAPSVRHGGPRPGKPASARTLNPSPGVQAPDRDDRTGRGGETAVNACEQLIAIAKTCYDNSSLGTSCAAVRARIAQLAATANQAPVVQDALASICERMCRANQDGDPWEKVRGTLQASCPRYD